MSRWERGKMSIAIRDLLKGRSKWTIWELASGMARVIPEELASRAGFRVPKYRNLSYGECRLQGCKLLIRPLVNSMCRSHKLATDNNSDLDARLFWLPAEGEIKPGPRKKYRVLSPPTKLRRCNVVSAVQTYPGETVEELLEHLKAGMNTKGCVYAYGVRHAKDNSKRTLGNLKKPTALMIWRSKRAILKKCLGDLIARVRPQIYVLEGRYYPRT